MPTARIAMTTQEQLNRERKAEAFADVMQASGITAADAGLGGEAEWTNATVLVNLMLRTNYDTPSDENAGDTRALVLSKLTRREMLARELRRK